METQRVTVIDGPLPDGIFSDPNMGPRLATAPELAGVERELFLREPIFHRPEFGITRADFEKMTALGFWEVSASGRRFSRQFVLDLLEPRYKNPTTDVWEISGFHCSEIAANNYLVTYTLFQGRRVTRRSTIWRRTADGWQIIFHQGTALAEGVAP